MFKAVVGQTDKAGYVAPHHRLQHVQGSSVYHTLFQFQALFPRKSKATASQQHVQSLCELVQLVSKYEYRSVGWNFLTVVTAHLLFPISLYEIYKMSKMVEPLL